MARSMVTRYGMSEKLGPISFGGENHQVFLGKDYNNVRNYSESIASQIDGEIEDIIRNAYDRTEKILSEHMDKLHLIAQKLFEDEKMSGEEFTKIMEEVPVAEEVETEEIEEMVVEKPIYSRKRKRGCKHRSRPCFQG